MGLRRIYKNYQNDGVDGLIYRIIKLLGFKIKYLNIREKNKYKLDQKIRKITKDRVIDGLYKGIFISTNNEWGVNDFSSKLLGLYERQIQYQINNIQKKNNLEFLVNFGSSDGYHLLGNMKRKNFKKAYAFEINEKERKILDKNLKKNNLLGKVKIYGAASFKKVKNLLTNFQLTKTLFLIDIESAEFDLFTKEFSDNFKNSFFIIENHDFLLRDNKKKINFDNLVKKFYKVTIIKNNGRNPFKFKFMKNFTDDQRWLIMSEQRPCEMNWILLEPKK